MSKKTVPNGQEAAPEAPGATAAAYMRAGPPEAAETPQRASDAALDALSQELTLMKRIARSLDQLPLASQQRVVGWLQARCYEKDMAATKLPRPSEVHVSPNEW